MSDDYVDGNELAGPLSEIFATDVTAVEGRCAHCGRLGPIARYGCTPRRPAGWPAAPAARK